MSRITLLCVLAGSVLGAAAPIEIGEAIPVGEEPETIAKHAENLDDTNKIAIFVYDKIAELDHTDLIQCFRDKRQGVPPWQDERMDMAQDMGEVWMHRTMLSHPWRELHPKRADLFYIPIYPVLSMKLGLDAGHRCDGMSHEERMNVAVEYLSRSSPFFNRFGGADHVLMCPWWNCREALGPWHRMMLRRTVVGINERMFDWARWGCGEGRMVTVPYEASSVLTTPEMLGGRAVEDRDISFFFVGTSRHRPERKNLEVVMNISEDSVIHAGSTSWSMNSTVYAELMSRSRFCFCPRGDTVTSRHIFDALAAGCIPIITEELAAFLPFSETREALHYSKFAVVVEDDAFCTREGVAKVARDVLSRSDAELAELRRGGRVGRSYLLYGVTVGPELSDMRPFLGPATKFLRASYALAGGGIGRKESNGETSSVAMWDCPETYLSADDLAPRTSQLPPEKGQTRTWLAESETIVNVERSLLFCAPPNTGSLQLRMLAKRMQGIPHWSVHNNRSLLFDPAASELELLDVTDESLMTKIYSDNGSGWIKIGVVRDPVTRLLSAYLDLARTWLATFSDGAEQARAHDRRQLQQLWQQEGSKEERRRPDQGRSQVPLASADSEWGLFDAIIRTRRRRQLGLRRKRYDGYEHNVSEGFHDGGGGGRSGGGHEHLNINSSDNRIYHHRHRYLTQQLLQQETQQIQRKLGEPHIVMERAHRHPFGHPETDEKEKRFDLGRPGGWFDPGAADATPGRTGSEGEPNGNIAAGNLAADDVAAGDGNGIHIPTFLEVVEALQADIWNAPVAFQPAASLCGQHQSTFDSIIPFEGLQKTSKKVIKSLPGDIWEAFGKSGWGPDGEHAFMEFDYGAGPWHTTDRALLERESADTVQVDSEISQREEGKNDHPFPRRARDLYEGEEPCAWVEYYRNMKTLEAVGKLYEMDYSHYRWYRIDPWRKRLKACLENER